MSRYHGGGCDAPQPGESRAGLRGLRAPPPCGLGTSLRCVPWPVSLPGSAPPWWGGVGGRTVIVPLGTGALGDCGLGRAELGVSHSLQRASRRRGRPVPCRKEAPSHFRCKRGPWPSRVAVRGPRGQRHGEWTPGRLGPDSGEAGQIWPDGEGRRGPRAPRLDRGGAPGPSGGGAAAVSPYPAGRSLRHRRGPGRPLSRGLERGFCLPRSPRGRERPWAAGGQWLLLRRVSGRRGACGTQRRGLSRSGGGHRGCERGRASPCRGAPECDGRAAA